MKRYVTLCVLLLALAYTPVLAQLDREAMERQRMRDNHIQESTQFTHKYTKSTPNAEGYKTCVTTYDTNGNPLSIVNYRANGDESSRHYYTYNAQGLKTEYRKEEPVAMGGRGKKVMKLFYKQQFTYDANGNKLQETGFDGTANYKITYSYLPNGRLSDITRYAADNTVNERWIYSYQGSKQIIRITPKNGKPHNVEKVYDDNGNLLTDTQFDAEGKEGKRVEYTYDSKGRIATESEFYEGKLRNALRYVFNAKGQLVQVMQATPSGKEVVNSDYGYDKEGNLVREQWIDGEPSLISKKDSQFDSQGNMVKVDSYYAPYKYRVMYTYKYKKF